MSDRMNCPKDDYCIPQETCIKNVRLATAYVPFQKLCTLYSPLEGLVMGTIFPELYSPFGKMKKCKSCREEEDEE